MYFVLLFQMYTAAVTETITVPWESYSFLFGYSNY